MITSAPIYALHSNKEFNWRDLNNPFPYWRPSLNVDFSIREQGKIQRWQEIAQKIGAIILKMVLFPWGLYELARYVVQRLVMLPLYPAQSSILKKWVLPDLMATEELDEQRRETVTELRSQKFIVRHVILEKNGTRYSGLLIGKEGIINNGKWALQATGNLEFIEHSAEELASIYCNMGFNTLLINGPGVGRSEGEANPQTMGEAQELGLCFLEEAIHAKKIVIAGRSLGGAAIGQAVLQHTFKKDVNYLVVRQMTFDRVSTICSKTVAKVFPKLEGLVRKLVIWAGCEIDSIAASKKLQDLKIKEVIVQCTCRDIPVGELPTVDDFETDGPIIKTASLGRSLIQENIIDNKVFIGLHSAYHMTNEAIAIVKEEIQKI